MTRVAGANPRIWVDIFLENRDALAAALAEHRRRVEQLEARSRPATPASSPAGSARRRRTGGGCSRRVRRPRRAAAAARPRARPAGRARRDHAGARRRADQHRGLRAAAPLARARRHARDARRGRGARRSARPRCSRRRATASSSRRCSRTTIVKIEPAAAISGTSPFPATSRSRTARCCSARSPRARRAISRLRPLRRHRVDDRGGPRARRRASTRPTPTTLRVFGAGLRGLTRAGASRSTAATRAR